ncbi:MAG: hypothetical protein ACI9U2_001762 [Bradymonadia bacterium]|jgi:hypothetical protein
MRRPPLYAFCVASLFAAPLVWPGVGWAQPTAGSDIPVEGSIRGGKTVPAKVTAEKVDLRAGPGAAYISRGRAYRDDLVKIRRRNEGGDWVEVSAGEVRGWMRFADLKRVRGDAARTADGAVDAGRDRRQRNYRYDEDGKRITAGGAPAAGPDPEDAPDAPTQPASAAPVIHLDVVIGASRMDRRFRSNIEPKSALDVLEGGATGLSVALLAEWLPTPNLKLRGAFRDSRLGSVTLPALPAAGFERGFSLSLDAQQVELDVAGGFSAGPLWLGAYVGGRLLRHAFQQTAPFPVFLTTTYGGVAAGGVARAAFGSLSVDIEGGVFLPITIDQAPATSGEGDAIGVEVRGSVVYALSPHWALMVHGNYTAITADFEGVGSHRDVTNDLGYDFARQEDAVIGGGLGMRWSP